MTEPKVPLKVRNPDLWAELSAPRSEIDPVVFAEVTGSAPGGRRFWLDDEMFDIDNQRLHRPRFSVQEASKVFFGKGPDWLRWRYKAPYTSYSPARDGEGRVVKDEEGLPVLVKSEDYRNYFVLDGEPLEPKTTAAGARYFTLADIERMATALCQNGAIDGLTLTRVVTMAVTMARLYELDLGEPDLEFEPEEESAKGLSGGWPYGGPDQPIQPEASDDSAFDSGSQGLGGMSAWHEWVNLHSGVGVL